MPQILDHPSTDKADTFPEAQLARILAKVPPILRLPKAGTRCPYTQLSRTGLSELVTPTRRNGGKPPVQARYQRAHRYAVRGVWLIPAEPLFRYLLGPGTQSVGINHGTNDLRALGAEEYIADARAARTVTEAGNIHLN